MRINGEVHRLHCTRTTCAGYWLGFYRVITCTQRVCLDTELACTYCHAVLCVPNGSAFLQRVQDIGCIRCGKANVARCHFSLAHIIRRTQTIDYRYRIDYKLFGRTAATAVVGVRGCHAQHIRTCRKCIRLAQIYRSIDSCRTATAFQHVACFPPYLIRVRIRIFGCIC